MARSPSLLFLAALALAPLAAACSKGGGGDPPSTPAASVLGNGQRISDVFGPATWYDEKNKDSYKCKWPADKALTPPITGVTVTAVDRFDEISDDALGNLYVQDTLEEPGEYEGMTVFAPSFSPPDLRVSVGDVLDFSGLYTEFQGPGSPFPFCETLPEISGSGKFRFEDSEIEPKVVTLADLTGYENARRYLGMLVRVENVKVVGDPVSSNEAQATGGRYTASLGSGAPAISNELCDVKNGPVTLADGTELSSVTGIVTFFYSFKIAPRTVDEIVP